MPLLNNKIKALFARKDKSLRDCADALGIRPSSLSKKMAEDRFTFLELKRMGEETRASLCYVDKDTGQIIEIL